MMRHNNRDATEFIPMSVTALYPQARLSIREYFSLLSFRWRALMDRTGEER